MRDYFRADTVCLIEWPEQGQGYLPEPDLDIHLVFEAEHRAITINACTAAGALILKALTDDEK
jgi:tRNA threonylcarbamoyladenosine biosynthesis protein TsaE